MHIFLCGLIIFLLGLEGSKKALNKIATQKVAAVLNNLSSNIFLIIILGILVTAVLQSSSAVSIILISLVESRVLSFKTAMGLILGANIGTTFTVQIISLPVLSLYPILIFMGIFLFLSGCFLKRHLKYIGVAVFSFGIVFLGLNLMTSFFYTESRDLFVLILAKAGENPYLGLLFGIIITSIIQSSSAVTGIIVSLAKVDMISLAAAIAIALGSNIGTCITAFIASINAGTTAKALARGHFLFNLIGVLLILPIINYFTNFIMISSSDLSRQIANAHTIFNTINVLVFLPFFNTFVSLLGGNDNGNN